MTQLFSLEDNTHPDLSGFYGKKEIHRNSEDGFWVFVIAKMLIDIRSVVNLWCFLDTHKNYLELKLWYLTLKKLAKECFE